MYSTWGELLNYMNYSIRSSMRILSFSNGALKRKIQSGKKTKETEKKYAKICFHISAGTRFRYSSFFSCYLRSTATQTRGLSFRAFKITFQFKWREFKGMFFCCVSVRRLESSTEKRVMGHDIYILKHDSYIYIYIQWKWNEMVCKHTILLPIEMQRSTVNAQ